MSSIIGNHLTSTTSLYSSSVEELPSLEDVFYGAAEGNVDIVKNFLILGGDVNTTYGVEENTLLHIAVYNKDESLITLLLEHGADIGALDGYGRSVLSHPIHEGDLNILDLLLDKSKAPTNVREEDGETPLHLAAEAGHEEIVQRFLFLGLEVDATNDSGQTPLHLACKHGNVTIAIMLMKFGARIDHAIFGDLFYRVVEARHLKMARFLLTYGADINEASANGRTPIHAAILGNNKEMAQMLMVNGATIDHTMLGNFLYRMVESGHLEMAKFLLAQGADINRAMADGKTPLHAAVNQNHVEMATMLIRNGARTDLRDSSGKLPYDLATNENMRQALLKATKMQPRKPYLRGNR